MQKVELFRKYIDNELSPTERAEVEKSLQDNQDDVVIFQSMQENRQFVLNSLEKLNPSESHSPAIRPSILMRKRNRKLFWSIAASVVVLMGMSFLIWLSLNSSDTSKDQNQLVELIEQEVFYDELDYYISPNRCWNERETIMIIIEIK